MEIIREVSRKELITFYLDREKEKRNHLLDINTLPYDNPNEVDKLFKANRYKCGVIPAFKKWDYVKLFKEDLLDCAIVNTIFSSKNQRLRDLIKEVENWKPDRETAWYNELMAIYPLYPEKWALILRPAVASESHAKWYVEDGSGRSLRYLQLLKSNKDNGMGFAHAYIGKCPDENSSWLKFRFPFLYLPT